jgi:hypothetical protein
MDEEMWLEHNLFPWLDDDSMADSHEEHMADIYDWDNQPLWDDEDLDDAEEAEGDEGD